MKVLTQEENTIVVNNIKMVETIATWLKNKEKYTNYDDLVSAGYEGLIRAVQTYNASKGKFATYAWTCIANAMRDDVRKFHNQWEVGSDEEDFFPNLPDDETEAWKIVDFLIENSGLTSREKYVIRTRFGIDCESLSTKEIAAILGKTPQRITGIKNDALEKMRLAA